MPAINDVVELPDGSVGVIGAEVGDLWRVYFPDSHLDVSVISQTLSAPTYQVGGEVTVWPDLGTIQSISGDTFTVSVTQSEHIRGVGRITWTNDQTVQRWRIIRDNDDRLERVY